MLPSTPDESLELLPKIARDFLRQGKVVFEVAEQSDGSVAKRATIYDTGSEIGLLRVQERSESDNRPSAIVQAANSYLVTSNQDDPNAWQKLLPEKSEVRVINEVNGKVYSRVTLVPEDSDPPILKNLWQRPSPARFLEAWVLDVSGETVSASNEQVGVGRVAPAFENEVSGQWNWSLADGPLNGAGFGRDVVKAGNRGKGVTVAILDSGITSPPAFTRVDATGTRVGMRFTAKNFCSEGGEDAVEDMNGHGTQCASVLIAEQSGENAFHAICPDIELLVGRVVTCDALIWESDAYRGILWALENHAQIITMSWLLSTPSQRIEELIKSAPNVLFVAAPDSINGDLKKAQKYPVCYENKHLIGVIASSRYGDLASGSDYDSSKKFVHVAAPGEAISICSINNEFGFVNGTSIAAPQVAGLAALLMGARPDLAPSDVIDLILETTTSSNFRAGHCKSDGRIDATEALRRAPTFRLPPQ